MSRQLTKACLLWGSLVVESKGGSTDLQGAPAEGWAALLTWHLNIVFVATTYSLPVLVMGSYTVHSCINTIQQFPLIKGQLEKCPRAR